MSPKMHGNVLSWASDIDPEAIAQAQRAASLPFVHGHLALMPDAHVGAGATIGSVIPTKGAVIPSAVGVDLGCGMAAVETELTSRDLPDNLDELHNRIAESVPAGVGAGHDAADEAFNALHQRAVSRGVEMTVRQTAMAARQLGSLGSGNHFVEVCLDERDRVWVVLHSGSRGIGNQLARVHIEQAKRLMKQYFIELEDPDLAYLVQGTDEFNRYIEAMLWAQDYALANREVMLAAVLGEFSAWLGRPVPQCRTVNCHHNFCQMEHHHGADVWVTRKGAVSAREGQWGIIPGSMGTRSYIVQGLGSAASYESCSHGAGRRLSRGQAKRELDLAGLEAQMAGRVWNSNNAEALLDEDPRAYKDIDQVMADQADLVRPVHTLSQILNYKGV